MLDSYPVTKLKRDDPRTLRWLRLLAYGLRAMDRTNRVSAVERTGRDPGPSLHETMASAVEEIHTRYEAGDYEQANLLQKRVANSVARIGGTDYADQFGAAAAAEAKAGEAAIMQFWKEAWRVAKNVAESQEFIDNGDRNIAAWDEQLRRRAGESPEASR